MELLAMSVEQSQDDRRVGANSHVELVNNGKTDERLEFVMNQVKLAVGTFVEAIKNSTDDQVAVSFKAFTLNTSKDEAVRVFDIIMSIVAIELHKQANEYIKQYTFFHSVEEDVIESTPSLHKLMLHCDKTKKPPTKEEIDALSEQNMANAVVEEKEDITLPHPSMMSAYTKPGSGE